MSRNRAYVTVRKPLWPELRFSCTQALVHSPYMGLENTQSLKFCQSIIFALKNCTTQCITTQHLDFLWRNSLGKLVLLKYNVKSRGRRAKRRYTDKGSVSHTNSTTLTSPHRPGNWTLTPELLAPARPPGAQPCHSFLIYCRIIFYINTNLSNNIIV